MIDKNTKMNGTVVYTMENISISEILKELYIELYGLEGLSEVEIDAREMASKDSNNKKEWIPSLDNFIHERRVWIRNIIIALVDEDAYRTLQIKQNGVPKGVADFICSLLQNDTYLSELRKKIVNKRYFEIPEEDVEVLRHWIDELFTDEVCDKEEKDRIFVTFDSHFALKYRNVWKEVLELQSLLGYNHIEQYSDKDYDWILESLIKLNREIAGKMTWIEASKEVEKLSATVKVK